MTAPHTATLTTITVSFAAFAALPAFAVQVPQPAAVPALAPASAATRLSAAGEANPSPPVILAAMKAYRDGKFAGNVTDAYYGDMQVQADISGGAIVAVEILNYPHDRNTSRRINARALPQLQDEVISAQTARVDMVSGATLTSRAFIQSLASALAQAR